MGNCWSRNSRSASCYLLISHIEEILHCSDFSVFENGAPNFSQHRLMTRSSLSLMFCSTITEFKNIEQVSLSKASWSIQMQTLCLNFVLLKGIILKIGGIIWQRETSDELYYVDNEVGRACPPTTHLTNFCNFGKLNYGGCKVSILVKYLLLCQRKLLYSADLLYSSTCY